MIDKYIEVEKRLAKLKGWYECLNDRWQSPITNDYAYLPQWCHDNSAAFSLMVEHGLNVDVDQQPECVIVYAHSYSKHHRRCELYCQHPDKETAVRYAIVMAVIAKLENQT